MMPSARAPLKVDGRVVDISNPEKVLYPKAGFRKLDVIDYYIRIAPALLPHMQGRPVSMKRYPDGVEGGYFFQKQAPEHRPDWMQTFPVPSDTRGKPIDYIVCDDRATLVWLANMADLELHTFMHRVPDLERPTMMVFDLDPGPPADVRDCAKVALWLRDILDGLKLKAFPKVSGGKGLQMHVPFNTDVTYEETGTLAKAMAQALEREHPEEVTSLMRKDLRGGKVFIDWSQNNQAKTTVCAYSLRAQPTPTVAAPVTWDEIEDGAKAKSTKPLGFSPKQVLDRYESDGDLMEPVLTLKQRMPGSGAPATEPKAKPGKGSKPTKRPARKATKPATAK